MFSILDRIATGTSPGRRELLQIGSLGIGGLSLPGLLQAQTAVDRAQVDAAFGRARNIIFLYLAGGPPQHETFDPKPDAPQEIRGAFNPIATTVPGIQFCELLPRTARLAHRLAVIRSMATDDNIHSSSGAWVLTGYKYRGPNARTIQPEDWPYFGSIVKMLKPAAEIPALSTVWIPDKMRLNENVTPAGQTGGFLGVRWDPERFTGNPADPGYEIESLRQTDVTAARLHRRRDLLARMEQRFAEAPRGERVRNWDAFRHQALDLLTSGKARQAFAIGEEPDAVRERYGRNRWGQCVLLARRLIEAGVRLVHVQWPREPGDNAVDNPLWDTHAQNADRLEDVLCPMFDVGYSALLEDLEARGLLDETLVVAIGEFGRTPRINAKGGRDHWGAVFSAVLAGAGIRGGQTYGASDAQGAYPVSDRVEPGDLTATMFHLLGIDHRGTFPDRFGRPHHLTDGEPLHRLLGTTPATQARTEPTGHIGRVPPFDPDRLLTQTHFRDLSALQPVTSPSRPKGWRVDPRLEPAGGFGGEIVATSESLTAGQHAALGLRNGQTANSVPANARILLAQEVRSPFSGTYELTVRAAAQASSAQAWTEFFLKHFRCRIVFFQFNSVTKRVSAHQELASTLFTPELRTNRTPQWQSFSLARTFVNPKPGANFSFGAGMGIAVIVERTTAGTLRTEPQQVARLLIDNVTLKFAGKQINDTVQV